MPIASMTGFARTEGHAEGLSWVWEMKSVNSKSLDLRFRFVPGFDALEVPLRALLAETGAARLDRGEPDDDARGARPARSGSIARRWRKFSRCANELVEQHGAAPPRADGLVGVARRPGQR